MKVEVLLGCQIAALLIALLMICIRVLVSYRKRWLPVSSERWGCGFFVFACLMCASLSIYWIIDASNQIMWANQGLSPLQIRLRLMDPAKWKGVYGTTLMAATCMWLGKFSFLLLYVSAYKQFGRSAKVLYYLAIWFTFLCFLSILFVFIFYCSPIRRNWTMDRTFCSTAISKDPLNVALTLSILSDVLLFAIPVVLIFQLSHRSRSEYTSLAFLIFLAIGSIVSTTYFVIDANKNNYNGGKPLTLAKRNIFIWNQVLANLLLLAAIAMPSVRLLMRSPQTERTEWIQRSGSASFTTVMKGQGRGSRDEEVPLGGVEMRGMDAFGEEEMVARASRSTFV